MGGLNFFGPTPQFELPSLEDMEAQVKAETEREAEAARVVYEADRVGKLGIVSWRDLGEAEREAYVAGYRIRSGYWPQSTAQPARVGRSFSSSAGYGLYPAFGFGGSTFSGGGGSFGGGGASGSW